MLRRFINHLQWRRAFNRTKRLLSYRATNRALILCGALRRMS